MTLGTLQPSDSLPAASHGSPNASLTWWQRPFAPVDIAALVYFRVAFAGVMLWEIWRYWSRDRKADFVTTGPNLPNLMIWAVNSEFLIP